MINMKCKVEDLLQMKRNPEVKRIILKVLDGHYEWKYPYSEEIFTSSNSNDPEFFWWEKVKESKDGMSKM